MIISTITNLHWLWPKTQVRRISDLLKGWISGVFWVSRGTSEIYITETYVIHFLRSQVRAIMRDNQLFESHNAIQLSRPSNLWIGYVRFWALDVFITWYKQENSSSLRIWDTLLWACNWFAQRSNCCSLHFLDSQSTVLCPYVPPSLAQSPVAFEHLAAQHLWCIRSFVKPWVCIGGIQHVRHTRFG
jgi:hypothetical protein